MLITLLTDFGTRDYFVAAMKGVISSINTQAAIIDITHEIEPQGIGAAAFTLQACYRDFPRGTIHVAVVDPGVGSARRAILVETNEYFFVAPDNGLLSFVFQTEKDFRVFEITNKDFSRRPVSRTFHGRDVFAPVAAHLATGIPSQAFGAEIRDFVSFAEKTPKEIAGNLIEASILHVDRFGNLITNLRQSDAPDRFSVEINGSEIIGLKDFYAEAGREEIFMIWGSAGFLEIAANQTSAANLLAACAGQKVFVKRL